MIDLSGRLILGPKSRLPACPCFFLLDFLRQTTGIQDDQEKVLSRNQCPSPIAKKQRYKAKVTSYIDLGQVQWMKIYCFY